MLAKRGWQRATVVQVCISVCLGSYICSGYGGISLRSVCPVEAMLACSSLGTAVQDREGWVTVADSKHWARPTWMRSPATPWWPQMWSHDFSRLQAFNALSLGSAVFVNTNSRSLGPFTIKKSRSRGWNLGALCLGVSSWLWLSYCSLSRTRMDCPHPSPLREPLEEALESEGGRLSASPDCLAPAHKIPHEQKFHLLFPLCMSWVHPAKLL